MMAKQTPDILLDFIQTDNILGDYWRSVAIDIASEMMPVAKTMPMFAKMLGHPSSAVRAASAKGMLKYKKLEEVSVYLKWFPKSSKV